MICKDCQGRSHEACVNMRRDDPRGTFCDCQHRGATVLPPAPVRQGSSTQQIEDPMPEQGVTGWVQGIGRLLNHG